MTLKSLFALLVFMITLSVMAQSNTEKLIELDTFIQKGIELWNPPGLAVTVVKDGDIIFKKGYGVTTIGTTKFVDETLVPTSLGSEPVVSGSTPL